MSARPLSPRQYAYVEAYARPESGTFGNAYQSALKAGYSQTTARNITHLKPGWLSDNIGQLTHIQPEDIMQELTNIIRSDTEPTIVRLKAIEMTMRAYSMLVQHRVPSASAVSISIDLSGSTALD
jgi:hypothetical protein